MSLNKINKITGDKTLVAGGTLFADNPIGTILPYGGTEAPRGWFLCQGQEISRTTYKDLFDIIGTAFGSGDDSTTFNLPDFRESVPVGVGENGTQTIVSHDTYTLGEFKDDQIQSHKHYIDAETTQTYVYSAGQGSAGLTNSNVSIPLAYGVKETNTPLYAREGATTHSKQLGVNYIIKALMIGIPIDFAGSILLNELGNVNIDDQTLSNGQALVYDSTTGKWVNGESGSQTIKDVDDIPVSQQIENIFYRTDKEDTWVTIDETMTLLEMAETIADNLHGNISNIDDTSVCIQPLTGYTWYRRSYQDVVNVDYISFHIINDNKEIRYHKGSGYTGNSITGSNNLWFAMKNGDFKYYAGNKAKAEVDRMAKYDDLPPDIWHGTREEWDALPTSEKITYQYTVFTDDVSGGGSSSGGGIWGTIAGTLSNQTDLQNALNNKLDVSKIKDAESLVAGDVYDVTYINTAISNIQTTIGDIQTILDNI